MVEDRLPAQTQGRDFDRDLRIRGISCIDRISIGFEHCLLSTFRIIYINANFAQQGLIFLL